MSKEILIAVTVPELSAAMQSEFDRLNELSDVWTLAQAAHIFEFGKWRIVEPAAAQEAVAITRYGMSQGSLAFGTYGGMIERDNGDWVKYEDHLSTQPPAARGVPTDREILNLALKHSIDGDIRYKHIIDFARALLSTTPTTTAQPYVLPEIPPSGHVWNAEDLKNAVCENCGQHIDESDRFCEPQTYVDHLEQPTTSAEGDAK